MEIIGGVCVLKPIATPLHIVETYANNWSHESYLILCFALNWRENQIKRILCCSLNQHVPVHRNLTKHTYHFICEIYSAWQAQTGSSTRWTTNHFHSLHCTNWPQHTIIIWRFLHLLPWLPTLVRWNVSHHLSVCPSELCLWINLFPLLSRMMLQPFYKMPRCRDTWLEILQICLGFLSTTAPHLHSFALTSAKKGKIKIIAVIPPNASF